MAQAAFPKTLKEFGYDFDADGKLRKLDASSGSTTNEGFEFNVSSNPEYNQKRYEALGEVINQYIYELLEQEGLEKIPVPKESDVPLESRSFIFASKDRQENDKLIILIHGSGVVKAGQWARRLIINDNLSTGTQIPYIKKAKELGYSILVLNTNDNQRNIGGKLHKIEGSEGPHEHLETVWNDYIQNSRRKHIAIIAHSYGGECVVQFAVNHLKEFKDKVFAVALTDSVHVIPRNGLDSIIKISRNWACSNTPLDNPILSLNGDIERVSAGHTVHEMSSSSCMDSVFAFIQERYRTISQSSEL